MIYLNQCREVLQASRIILSTITPSEWAEKNRYLPRELTKTPGMMSYKYTPYLIEPVNNLCDDNPCTKVAYMKSGQIGFSTGVIETGIGWIISQNPGPILYLTGHSDLTDEAMDMKVDSMLNNSGIRHLIRPNAQREKNNKTGDTTKRKEFAGGSLIAGSANHKTLRQRTAKTIFVDDFEAMKRMSQESGSTRKLIEWRASSFGDSKKLIYISTPEIAGNSNIHDAYLLGDQRKYFWPCPCCGDYIHLEWEIELEGEENEKAGMTWQLDDHGKIIPGSIGYICQKCGGFFDESYKYELNLRGEWRPTAEPSEEGFRSYHISGLYAPPGQMSWKDLVNDYIAANPPGQPQKEDEMKTFMNLGLGLPFEAVTSEVKAHELQLNAKGYRYGTVPEELSIRQGNGRIVLLTCACDLNGVLEDARLDWEIVAWSESGSSYSVGHGSIGTFIPREGAQKNQKDRPKWTYEYYKPNSVWPELDKIIKTIYKSESGQSFKVFSTGVDTGHLEHHAFVYISKTNSSVIGLKGDKEDSYTRVGVNAPNFKEGRSRANLYLLNVGQLKDDLAELIKLKWDPKNEKNQPPGYLNFPYALPEERKYTYEHYFVQYEAEKRESDPKKPGAFRWVKKNSNVQNHYFDVKIYNMAMKEIITNFICKSAKMKIFDWSDFCKIALKIRFKS